MIKYVLMLLVLGAAAVSYAKPPIVDEVLHYVGSDGKWTETKVSEFKPYKIDKDIYKVDGILVEMHLGDSGLDRITAILCKYSDNKDDSGLFAYNEGKNIGLLYYKRWNNVALSMMAPDADEILARHGFKCNALDVCRLLRIAR